MWKEKTQGWAHDENNIKGFFDKYRFLSNFEPCTIYFDGAYYPSSENAYMAAKTLSKSLRKDFENISAFEAKQLGKTIKLREDWDEVKLDIMYRILSNKFFWNTELKKKLLSTGDKYLEETNWWGDKIWGVCRGEGENNLGKILMRIREELRNGSF